MKNGQVLEAREGWLTDIQGPRYEELKVLLGAGLHTVM